MCLLEIRHKAMQATASVFEMNRIRNLFDNKVTSTKQL